MRERERKRDGYLTSGSHAKAEREGVERERGARGRGSSLLTKREGEKAASKASGGTVHRAGEEGEATAKKSWKEGDDGED